MEKLNQKLERVDGYTTIFPHVLVLEVKQWECSCLAHPSELSFELRSKMVEPERVERSSHALQARTYTSYVKVPKVKISLCVVRF